MPGAVKAFGSKSPVTFLQSLLSSFALFVLLPSCGYQWGERESLSLPSLSIPYLKGDTYGLFTEALIRELSCQGGMVLQRGSSDLIFDGSMCLDRAEPAGFQFDPWALGKGKRLVANEERRLVEMEFSILSGSTGERLQGPFRVGEFVDYDFVISDSLRDLSFTSSGGKRESTLAFSLGQLDAKAGAFYSAAPLLAQRVAKKVATSLPFLLQRAFVKEGESSDSCRGE